jgi:hypothetical protein
MQPSRKRKRLVKRAASYADAIDFLRKVEDPKPAKMNQRDIYSPQKVAALRRQFPGVPEDFLAYLREVGAGNFRECQFKVYGALCTPDELLGKGVFDWLDPRTHVLCFGDNFSGDLSGFLPEQDWEVVELWHDSGRVHRVGKSFAQYIRTQMLMGPNGADLRET